MFPGTKYTEQHKKSACTFIGVFSRTVDPVYHKTGINTNLTHQSFFHMDERPMTMYNTTQTMAHPISSNRPDLIILGRTHKSDLLTDVTCPMSHGH
eukprot:3575794-Ditylum_brightwellii.AAC.1